MKNFGLIWLLLFAFGVALSQEKGDLTVNIVKIDNDEGQIIVYLHNNPEAFPMDSKKAYRQKKVKIKKGKASVTFKSVKYGEYAVAAHHDEDGDGKVDINIIGMPSEELHASKNATSIFGPPDFEDAKIELKEDKKTIYIYFDK